MRTGAEFHSNPTAPRTLGPEIGGIEDLAQELEQAYEDLTKPDEKEQARLDDLHRRLHGFFTDEMERQAHNRYQMAIDEDYFDGLQWDDDEIMRLMERMQAPLVYNAIKPTVLWMLGTERRTRTDFKVRARSGERDAEKDAEVKTGTLKYVNDVNKTRFTSSEAFKECVISGLGWLEDGATNNPSELPIYAGSESWKNILHDSIGRDLMLKDARFIFRFRDVDEDVAMAMFPLPWQKAHIKLMCSGTDTDRRQDELWYMNNRVDSADWPSPARTGLGRRNFIDMLAVGRTTRRRMRLIEAWYRVPKGCFVCRGELFDGKEFDHRNPEMVKAYKTSAIQLINQVQMKMRVAFMTEAKVLVDQESPYRHNDFPFTPVWCYRRGRDGAPYGAVREMRDPQDSLNKHMSKTQWLLASNQIIADDDAVTDWKRARRQADKPNGTIRKKRGTEFRLERHNQEASQHTELAQLDLSMIRENYGGNMESLGVQSNASSGKAILARQEQGTVQVQPIFDNFLFARQVRGQKQLSLMEQYMTEPHTVPAQGKKRGTYEYLKVNQPIQREDGTWGYENDLTAMQADFIVDEQDWRASLRQAMAETMGDMIAKMPPEMGFRFLDMWVEFIDIPNKEEYIARIRQLNGMGEQGEVENQQIEEMQAAHQEELQMVQQQAEQAVAGLEEQAKALEAKATQLQATVNKQAVMLANKAEELRLRQQEIDDRHAENMAKIEAERERAYHDAQTDQQRQAIDADAGRRKDEERGRAEVEGKKNKEALAALEQEIAELQAALKEATKAPRATPTKSKPRGKAAKK